MEQLGGAILGHALILGAVCLPPPTPIPTPPLTVLAPHLQGVRSGWPLKRMGCVIPVICSPMTLHMRGRSLMRKINFENRELMDYLQSKA